MTKNNNGKNNMSKPMINSLNCLENSAFNNNKIIQMIIFKVVKKV